MTQLIRVGGWDRGAASVIFVHGLGGHAYHTWCRQGRLDTFWPIWLASDIPGLNAYVLSYPAPASNWLGTSMPLQDRAVNVLETLLGARDLRNGPIAFVCHSLGGLIVKQTLREADDRKDHSPEAAELLSNVRKVVFVATPHTGSAHATWLDRLRFIAWPSSASQGLVANDPALRNLNVWYRRWSDERRNIGHYVFYEMQGTPAGMIVDAGSSDPGLPRATPVPIDADHVGICKPDGRSDLVYARTRDFLADLPDAGAPKTPAPALAPGPSSFSELPQVARATPRNFMPMAVRIATLAAVGFVAFKGIQAIVGGDDIGRSVVDKLESTVVENVKLKSEIEKLRAQLASIQTTDPENAARKIQASAALDRGDVRRANELIQAINLRKKLLGEVAFRQEDRDRVVFTNEWDTRNIVEVTIPQLRQVKGFGSQEFMKGTIRFHKDGAGQLQRAFADIEKAGLLGKIASWCGSYVPRVVRAGNNTLSVHALGIAFDINCETLRFGQLPGGDALKSIEALEQIFEKHGIMWGGRFSGSAVDPNHFQLFRLDGPGA